MNTTRTPPGGPASRFFPFSITIVDVVEILNAAMLVLTGYNIGNKDGWFAISTAMLYGAGKKFVEIAKAKQPASDTKQSDLHA